jgi:adenylate cyclase
MNYTALGNTVNLAARLEGLNKQVGTTILASEDVYLRVRDQLEFSACDAVVAKGMTRETRIFAARKKLANGLLVSSKNREFLPGA